MQVNRPTRHHHHRRRQVPAKEPMPLLLRHPAIGGPKTADQEKAGRVSG